MRDYMHQFLSIPLTYRWLITLAFVCGGLFMARLLGALLGAEFSSYTVMGLLFEILSCTFATRLLDRAAVPAPA